MLNAEALIEAGNQVKIILEGKSVTLPKVLEEEKNPLYKKLLDEGVIVGVCKACSKILGVYEDNERLVLTFLDDMKGHAGMKKYIEEGYQVLIFWGGIMIFSFDSYMINVNTYKTEEFMKKLNSADVDFGEKIISTLAEISIDYKKPSYIKKLGNNLILKYHAVGEIISYGDVRTNADLKLADGIHPIYFLDEAEIYFTEAVEMREDFLDENSFEININTRIK